MQKVLSKFLSAFTVLSMLVMPLASMPTTALAAASPAIVWPTSWTTPAQCSVDISDENPSSIDLLGTLATPAVGFGSDANYQYFRERLGGNPGTPGSLDQKSWVVLFQKTLPEYQFLGTVNGNDEKVQLLQNTSAAGPVDFSPLLNDPAETVVWEGAAADYSRVTTAGGAYFVDWAIPTSVLNANGISTSTTKFFATSADSNNFNKDHLNCYEQIANLSIIKTDSPDPVATNGVLTYTLTVTNSGPDTAVAVVVNDTLPAGFSLTSVTPSSGSCSDTTAPTIQCELGDMANAAVRTVTISGTATTGPTLSNTATVTATTLDNSTGNNSDTEETTVTPPPAPSYLTLAKTVVNDNGGTAVDTNWTLSASGSTPISGVEGDASITAAVVTPGSYDLSEGSGPAGYTPSDWVCVGGDQDDSNTVVIAAGDNVTCTITNDDQQAYITVNKTVVNNNGGEAEANDFLLKVDASAVSDNVPFAVNPGAHVVSETNLPGYSAGVWGGDCDSNGNVTAVLGITKTCTITNDDDAPSLTLNKELTQDNGGGSFYDILDFILSAIDSDDNVVLSGTDGVTSGGTFLAGTYTLSESGPTGYTASAWECDNEDNDGTISIGLGEDVNCTITNNDNQAKLTIIKDIENNDGGDLTLEGVNLYIDDTEVTSGAENLLDAGSYTVSEDEVDGYIGTIGGDCAADGSVTLLPGDDKTCTITNDDVAPGLTVIKQITNNNGGTAVVADFTLHVMGSDQVDNTFTSGAGENVPADTYVVSETGPTGYQSTFSGDCDSNGSVTLEVGDTKVCTITNDDIAPSLTLVKQVVKDNGGTAVAADWTLSANGNKEVSTDISGAGGVESDGTFLADTYTLSETTGPAGYSAGNWSCTGVENTGNQITLGLGQEATCTIVNNDIAPSLTLIKNVDNELGGTADPEDWTLTATGATTISGPGGVDSGATFSAGTYTLTESTGPDNYNPASFWQCEGGSFNGTNEITLALGESADCSITNTYTPVVYECSDGDDNADAEDNLSDENDPGCHTDKDVNNPDSYVPTDDSESNEATECSDGVNNNDVDNLVDSEDPACHTDGDATDDDDTYDPGDNDEATECSDEADNGDGEDELSDANDPGCHTDGDAENEESYDPNDPSESNRDEEDNGGGSSSGSRPDRPQGEVLGAATEICNWNTQYLRRGWYKNVPGDVQTMQNFLNTHMTSGLAVDSNFGPLTEAAVKAFQAKYSADILAPWGINSPTGIWYLSTTTKAKELMCGEKVALPQLINWSQNPAVK